MLSFCTGLQRETFIRSRRLPTRMNQEQSLWVPWPIVAVPMTAMVVGCEPLPLAPSQFHPSQSLPDSTLDTARWSNLDDSLRSSPSGVLRVRPPLVNVSVGLTAKADHDATAYLFVVPNTSLEASLFVAVHCGPILSGWLDGSSRFNLGPLPMGRCVVMLRRGSFPGIQGFLVVNATGGPDLVPSIGRFLAVILGIR